MAAPYRWQDYFDVVDDVGDGSDPGDECGRWVDGQHTRSCRKAGSEDCDFECPYRDSLYR